MSYLAAGPAYVALLVRTASDKIATATLAIHKRCSFFIGNSTQI